MKLSEVIEKFLFAFARNLQLATDDILKFRLRGFLGEDQKRTLFQFLDIMSKLCADDASEGKTITDPVEIVDKFCKYFTNISPSLAGAIRDVNSSFSSFLSDVNHPPITLQPTDLCELESICNMFASVKAPGYDNMSMRVIKH